MSENKYFDILEKVYLLTNNTTPRSFDCGELCGKRCCGNLSHSEHKSGMALLPYEKEFLINKGAEYQYDTNDDGDILICNGSCRRELRPFACRIFPYYADVQKDRIKVKKDLRAVSVCPLLLTKVRKRPDIYYIRSIKLAVKLLLSEEVYRKNIADTSEFIEYLYDLYAKMKD